MAHLWTALWAVILGHVAIAALQDPLAFRQPNSLDNWLASETTLARQGILDNIGSTGAYAVTAKPGVLIASPSTSNPDCETVVALHLIFKLIKY